MARKWLPKKRDEIAAPFWNLLKVARKCKFDDFSLILEGKVDDLERSHELEERFPFCEVVIKKHNGKKQGAVIRVSKDFMKTAKTALNDEWEEFIDSNAEDGCIYGQS